MYIGGAQGFTPKNNEKELAKEIPFKRDNAAGKHI